MNLADEISFFAAFTSCIYIASGVLCRIRHGNIAKTWATVYSATLGTALWTLMDIVNGQAGLRDTLILVTMATYIVLTQKSWADGVPKIARRCDEQ